jgi:hypothetical protein
MTAQTTRTIAEPDERTISREMYVTAECKKCGQLILHAARCALPNPPELAQGRHWLHVDGYRSCFGMV